MPVAAASNHGVETVEVLRKQAGMKEIQRRVNLDKKTTKAMRGQELAHKFKCPPLARQFCHGKTQTPGLALAVSWRPLQFRFP